MTRILAFLFLLLPAVTVTAQGYDDVVFEENSQRRQASMDDSWAARAGQKLDEMIRNSKMLKTSSVGIKVYDLTDNCEVYSHDAQQRHKPASTMKVITAVTAMDVFGPEHDFVTELRFDGHLTDGTLEGNLYCVGGMDPCFNSDDMSALVNALKQRGISRVSGKICADMSFKDPVLLGEGWMWDDDNPQLSPLLVNKSSKFLPEFIKQLRQGGITVDADTATLTASYQARLLAHRIHSLDDVLNIMMKNSDNLYAEAVFYHLAKTVSHGAVSAKQAREAIRQLVERLGLSYEDYTFTDGSGLSHYNMVTAELEVEYLKYAYRHKKIYEKLYKHMPIAGVDGTLKKRMQNGPAYANVVAKTGTIRGVSSLAGYFKAPNGHIICFSILNQGIVNASDGRAFQDRLLQMLCALE
ncbi:MAG: D-alanyl-D-alanine carboxypeptidase/D-alanyl-D-alanine-endopeptidase [Prevotella sp.]|nr:D-alanyl-D-alanine carboxypeptidase/D-alanyl-D-alanine-endopeptidase [Prevotella sp.]